MTIALSLIRQVLDQALEKFFLSESEALRNDVSERSNCGRLAIYLQNFAFEVGLRNYYADVEYNRKQGGQVKTILDEKMKVITINCDLILHSRGASVAEDNLIAIEMKKGERPAREKTADRDRLRAMTQSSYDGVWSNDGTTHPEHVCGYVIGAYVELKKKKNTALLEYYARGKLIHSTTTSY
jgi:hypothetical protein